MDGSGVGEGSSVEGFGVGEGDGRRVGVAGFEGDADVEVGADAVAGGREMERLGLASGVGGREEVVCLADGVAPAPPPSDTSEPPGQFIPGSSVPLTMPPTSVRTSAIAPAPVPTPTIIKILRRRPV